MKIDIYAGFLGAGKTTLIRKMIAEGYTGEKLVLIENEFGEVDVDSGFLQETGVEIRGLNAGCICCSLVGDFTKALQQVIDEYTPDRIIIEPSGVGKLTEVMQAVTGVCGDDVIIDHVVSVANAKKFAMYLRNFNEFYRDQLATAHTVVLSRTDELPEEKRESVVAEIRAINEKAVVVTTPWDQLTGAQMLAAMEPAQDMAAELMAQAKLDQALHALMHTEESHDHHEHEHHHAHGETCGCGHDHHEHEHHHAHGETCGCGHDHHEHEHHHAHGETCGCGHDHHEHEHHHAHGESCGCGHDHHEHEHHHEHGESCGCGHDHHEHEHHHEHGESCGCGHDHHEHEHHHAHGESCGCGCGHDHGHHHADEVFQSWGIETTKKYSVAQIEAILHAFDEADDYGMILRAKGYVENVDGGWIYFDYVPAEHNVRAGEAAIIGKLCVIGAGLNQAAIAANF